MDQLSRRGDYYDRTLSAERLRRVYELAPPRVRQYLDAELRHIAGYLSPGLSLLELGCGYGRALSHWCCPDVWLYGVDISQASLRLAGKFLPPASGVMLGRMDAARLAFADGAFDLVVCIQNGLSAFGIDPVIVLGEALRVSRPTTGRVIVSTYSELFWEYRLDWFRKQSAAGLLGEIDETATKDGRIVCRDGFTATTFSGEQLEDFVARAGGRSRLELVDQSSLFCEIRQGDHT